MIENGVKAGPAGVSQRLREALACPMCLAWPLTDEGTALRCERCGDAYPVSSSGQLDLRLRRARSYEMSFEVGSDPTGLTTPAVGAIPFATAGGPAPDGKLPASISYGNRLTPELLSHFPRFPEGGLLLDLGCGRETFRPVAARTGLEYVGIDYDGQKPRILADAHSLPFRDETFDFVMSFAVLEHVQYPFVVLREVARVMKPGARFIGTVAFLEPFHRRSLYHMTHLGTHNLLASAGLEVEHLEPNAGWTGLRAIAELSLFPRMPMAVARWFVAPTELLHRLWWSLGHRLRPSAASGEMTRRAYSTGGFRFISRKP